MALPLGAGAVALGLAACPLRKPAPDGPELPQAPLPERTQRDAGTIRYAAEDGSEVSELDLDQDGRAELRIITAPSEGGPGRLIRKELDMNGDGRPDLLKHYGPDGALAQESYDANFDGVADAISDYRAGERVRTERDEDSDGRRETVILYEGGEISQVEIDADGDGRAELRESWNAGRISDRLQDLDGDGRWEPVAQIPLDAGLLP